MDVRLILDPPAPGCLNMAIDEALFESASRGETILRFYSWVPATLSLGYFQAYEDRQLHPASEGLDVVRRSTGGGAIVHDQELTYSFVTPISHRFSRDHQQLVRAFHETLCDSLSNWQISANLYRLTPSGPTQMRQSSKQSFLCFQRREIDDVILGDTKIAGSAQRRRRNALLQHGSVLLAKSSHAPELLGIGNFAKLPTADTLIDAWAGNIATRLGANFVLSKIVHKEYQAAENHVRKRYGAEEWLKRR
jgi:lipoate-protein ligase A